MCIVGQAFMNMIPFSDGEIPKRPRPSLIIMVENDTVGILNVSCSDHKEQKLLWSSNYLLTKHDPPFPRSSFVKLDSYREVGKELVLKHNFLSNRKCLCKKDIDYILDNYKSFNPKTFFNELIKN